MTDKELEENYKRLLKSIRLKCRNPNCKKPGPHYTDEHDD